MAGATAAAATPVYCVCREPYDVSRFMIECDICKDWFHGRYGAGRRGGAAAGRQRAQAVAVAFPPPPGGDNGCAAAARGERRAPARSGSPPSRPRGQCRRPSPGTWKEKVLLFSWLPFPSTDHLLLSPLLLQETQGVCVAAFGESREFPAFFSRQSGFQAPYHVRDEEEAAKLIDSALGLGLSTGVLIAVPCPQERAAEGQAIEEAIQQALSQARSKGIIGKEVTPFLLQKLVELTDGKSLDSNLALIQNNARVGSCIAVALSKLQEARRKKNLPRPGDVTAPQPVVIGGINVDFIAKAQNPDILSGGQTNAGRVRRTFGGVGRNLADCLSRLGQAPLLLSAVGKDEHLESVLHYCHHMDMSSILQLEGKSTATYCAVITSAGELSLGLGDMDIHQQITEQYVSQFKEKLCQAPLVCMDGNLPLSTIQYVCQLAREHQLAVCYEPTDVNKASKPFLSDSWKALTFISPNLQELRAINRTLGNPLPAELPSRLEDVIQAAVALACPLLAHLHCVLVTLGAHGVLLCGKSLGGSISLYPGAPEQAAAARLCAAHYPAIPISREEIVNVSGAGDSLMAGILAGMLAGHDTGTCVRMGLLAASLSLRSYEPISPEISTSSVSQQQVQSRSWPEVKLWNMD
ncbi:uncharacterized protein LOC130263955 [Oenanthe melanoleuca]|uniref:uncharacterized protein LOC130263955 n=1 Tax=Oenanthe melanoleuca TaxID=2939378 RepID=UPI0024C0F8DF|nr:uncharacterized protein LOC130263955 [Oenanthe melanoleuca]